MNLSTEFRRLREMDWRELDIKEAGSWPLPLQALCCLLVLGGILWGMHVYLAAPKAERLASAEREEEQLVRDFRSKAAQAANLPAMREQVEVLERRLDGLLAMLPSSVEIPSLIDNISETAIDNQLSIESIRLDTPVAREFYTEQPFDIRVSGDYHRIASFLAGVAGLPRIVTQHDFGLTPEGSDGRLQLSMLARTYSYTAESAEGAQNGEKTP